MDNQLTILKISEKVEAYIEEVEKETGRQVLLKSVQDVGLEGLDAVFKVDPVYILAEFIENKYQDSKGNINQEEVDRSIVHEVTHGFLAYKKGHYQFNEIFNQANETERLSIPLLFTMIEDIVVHKITCENNFLVYPQSYIKMVNKEIDYMRDRKDIYINFSKYGLLFKDRFMIWRYIQAWGLLEYANIYKLKDKKNLNKFLNIFQKSYYKQYKEAEKIITIIKEKDIFTTEGFNETIKECLDLWNLANLVEIYTC